MQRLRGAVYLREGAIERIAAQIDIVEVINGRSQPEVNRRADELCKTLGVPAGAGSDAHTLAEIGRVYIDMESFDGPQDFLVKVRHGRVVSGANPWFMAARRLLGRRGREP